MLLLINIVIFWCSITSVNCELNCSKLNIDTGTTSPFSGIALTYCPKTTPQCCTNDYLQGQANDTKEKLTNSLKNELLGENFLTLRSIANDMQKYMEDTFLSEFASRFTLINKLKASNRENSISSFVNSMTNYFQLNSSSNFNFSIFFSQHLHDINIGFINDYLGANSYVIGGLNNIRRSCLSEILDKNEMVVNTTAIQGNVNNIDKLRQIYSFINDMRNWYENNLVPKILKAQFTSTCVDTFVRLQCAACVQNIPSLCRSNCQYLTYGCFVPFRQGLAAQINILWNVTRQLLNEQSVNVLSEIFNEQKGILKINLNENSGFSTFASIANAECGILVTKSFGRKRRSTSNTYTTLPSTIMSNSSNLDGLLEYNNSDVPLFCQSNPIRNCWDGTQEKNKDDTIIDYDDSIENQDMNPVVSFNRTELLVIAQSFGTPVSDFLENHNLLTGINIDIPVGERFELAIEPRPAASSTYLPSSTTSASYMLSSVATVTPTTVMTTGPNSGHYLTPSFVVILLSFFFILLMIYF